MKPLRPNKLKVGLLALSIYAIAVLSLPAEDILFIGNSFTFGGNSASVAKLGGVPKLVEAIAASKKKTASTMMVTTAGEDWTFHLANPATDKGIKSRAWNSVVLQDLSLKPTHAGDVTVFMKNGEMFDERISRESPSSQIILYETWAYGEKNPVYRTQSGPKKFAHPGEMIGELHKNYAALQKQLQAKDPQRQILVAPVGTAFALSLQEHPEIDLYSGDFKHADKEGYYLAALVIYATVFHDSPVGATGTFSGFKLDDTEVAKLQAVAADVTK